MCEVKFDDLFPEGHMPENSMLERITKKEEGDGSSIGIAPILPQFTYTQPFN